VERILTSHPAVREAAVVAAPDSRLGEVPIAFVVGIGAKTEEAALRDWAQARMANFKMPRSFVAVRSLPRNASMKVLKNELRERVRGLPPNPR